MANQSLDIDQNMQLLVSAIMILLIGVGSLFMLIILLKKIPKYDHSLDIYEYEELTIEKKSNRMIDFIPVLVVVIIFINLNFKYLFK